MTLVDDNLTIYDEVEQGSNQWHELRLGKITASTLGKFITPTGKVAKNKESQSAINQLAAERLSNRGDDPIFSRDVQRGHLDEPLAREIYEDHTGLGVYEVGFMVRNFQGVEVGFSPDGLTVDFDGFIEVKSRKPRLQVEYILSGKIPHDHYIQMQTGMFVSKRAWCDYLAYSGGLPMHITRVYPDPETQNMLGDISQHVEAQVQEKMSLYEELNEGMPMTEYVDHWGDDIEITF